MTLRSCSAALLALLALACSEYELNEEKEVLPPEDSADPVQDTQIPEDTDVEPVVVEESWVLEPGNGVDVVIFGDTSGSMTDELTTLGEKITEFILGLSAYTENWQLMAITGPSGCAVDTVFDSSTSDYAARFAAAILTAPGEDLVDEWGLYNIAMALDNTGAGGCNEGFLRDEAPLHVIFISDEDDNSPGWDSGDTLYWSPYVERILAHKRDPAMVHISSIVGPIPAGCDGAEPGWGYAEAAEAVGGTQLSICTTWYEEIGLLVDMTVSREAFTLTQMPDPESLEVEVNGAARAAGWTWVEVTNTVYFTDDLPVTGDTVIIRYMPAGA